MSDIMVILPTYNEAENLRLLVPRILDLGLVGLGLLIVDDDSPDGTGEVAEQFSAAHSGRVQVLHRIGLQRGLGAAYIDGFRKVLMEGAKIVIGMDADLSHDPAYIPRMVDLSSRFDLIVGSRYVPGGGIDGSWGWKRVALSRCAQRYIRLMLGLRTHDATSAFRCYRRDALTRLNLELLQPVGFSFLIEILYQAELLGFKIQEMPIRFRDRKRGESKVSMHVIASALTRVPEVRLRKRLYDQMLFDRESDRQLSPSGSQ